MFSKKISKYLIGIVTASILVGCGAEDEKSATASSTSTDVTVERGALFDAVVKDANGIVATAKSRTSNVYTFPNTPTYPITAANGYIDVNGDGVITTDDIEFSGELKSYSNVVTPITTYIAMGTTETERTAKLAELKAKISGTVSDDDLIKKVPSSTTADIVALTNAIYDSYDVLFDTVSTNNDISSITTFDDDLAKYKLVITQSGSGKTVKELASLVEEELISFNSIPKLTEYEIEEYNNSLFSYSMNEYISDLKTKGSFSIEYAQVGNYLDTNYNKNYMNYWDSTGFYEYDNNGEETKYPNPDEPDFTLEAKKIDDTHYGNYLNNNLNDTCNILSYKKVNNIIDIAVDAIEVKTFCSYSENGEDGSWEDVTSEYGSARPDYNFPPTFTDISDFKDVLIAKEVWMGEDGIYLQSDKKLKDKNGNLVDGSWLIEDNILKIKFYDEIWYKLENNKIMEFWRADTQFTYVGVSKSQAEEIVSTITSK